MPRGREEHLLYIGNKESYRFPLAAIISCSVATLIVVITKYSYVFGYIQRGFGNGISVAQARVRMQSGHAKGTRGVRQLIIGKILPLTAWMFALLIIETPTSQSVDLFTCQWNVSKMRLGRHVRYMMTTFLADLDLNCETKKKDWATYRKIEVIEVFFIVFTVRVSEEVCQANSRSI